jgi:hypothetical protein
LDKAAQALALVQQLYVLDHVVGLYDVWIELKAISFTNYELL